MGAGSLTVAESVRAYICNECNEGWALFSRYDDDAVRAFVECKQTPHATPYVPVRFRPGSSGYHCLVEGTMGPRPGLTTCVCSPYMVPTLYGWMSAPLRCQLKTCACDGIRGFNARAGDGH